jgi:hypothetical protein
MERCSYHRTQSINRFNYGRIMYLNPFLYVPFPNLDLDIIQQLTPPIGFEPSTIVGEHKFGINPRSVISNRTTYSSSTSMNPIGRTTSFLFILRLKLYSTKYRLLHLAINSSRRDLASTKSPTAYPIVPSLYYALTLILRQSQVVDSDVGQLWVRHQLL